MLVYLSRNFETVNGFRATAKFRILRGSTTTPININLDLTDPDSEEVLLPVQERSIFHHYSDTLKVSVISYALEEIMAEKIRSLFQRTRSRDLYDIGHLADRVNREDVKSILLKKCELKGVIVDQTLLIRSVTSSQRHGTYRCGTRCGKSPTLTKRLRECSTKLKSIPHR